jgi:tetratricopeptide (TPR) repeat protein
MFLVNKILLLVALTQLPLAAASPSSSANKLLAEGRVDDAVLSLRNTINAAPNDAESYNLLCRAYFTLANWDRGIAACEKAVSLDSGNSQYHLWLGRVYGEKADHSSFLTAAGLAKKVRDELETSVRLDPSNVAARADLAEFYLEAPGMVGGGKDKAAAQADKLIALDPVKAGWVKGRLAEKKKNFPGAELEYRTAVEASHGRADAWVNLARFYRNTNHILEMREAIQHVGSAPLNQPSVLMDAAEVLVHAGQDQPMAVQFLRRYLSSDSSAEDNPLYKAHYLLGTLLEQSGDKPGAAQEYRASLNLAKGFSTAQTALNRINRQVAEK